MMKNKTKCFIFHNWDKWEIIKKGNLTYTSRGYKEIVGEYITQQRVCKRCGYTQIKQIDS